MKNHGNSLNCHGNVMELYYQISVGTPSGKSAEKTHHHNHDDVGTKFIIISHPLAETDIRAHQQELQTQAFAMNWVDEAFNSSLQMF